MGTRSRIEPGFRCIEPGPLSKRVSAWKGWGDVIATMLYTGFAILAVIWLAMVALTGTAFGQTTVQSSSLQAGTCWYWGGSGSAGQGQFSNCQPVVVVTQVKTEVREVKVPVPVPGPTKVERVEVPAPPAKKVRD